MNAVCGSGEAADFLIRQLRQCQSELHEKSKQLWAEMEHLKQSCRDDSLQQMQTLLNTAITSSALFHNNLGSLCRILTQYRDFLNNLYIYTGAVSQIGTQPGNPSAPVYQPSSTKQAWHLENGSCVFDSPDALGKQLDTQQGKTNLGGSCGICSCENVARMAGLSASEDSVYQLARKKGLCTPEGGSTPSGRASLLTEMGIPAHCEPLLTPAQLAAPVMNGQGVILSVLSDVFYQEISSSAGLHAITVTSVRVDSKGRIEGFYICDSNAHALGRTGSVFYEVDRLWPCLSGRDMVVTDQSIR